MGTPSWSRLPMGIYPPRVQNEKFRIVGEIHFRFAAMYR